MKTKEIINIVTQDENICPVCGASIKRYEEEKEEHDRRTKGRC